MAVLPIHKKTTHVYLVIIRNYVISWPIWLGYNTHIKACLWFNYTGNCDPGEMFIETIQSKTISCWLLEQEKIFSNGV